MATLAPTFRQPDLDARWRSEGLWLDEPLGRSIAALAVEHPDRVALIDGDHRFTFAELDANCTRLADALVARGVEPGNVVTIQLPNWWETVTVCLAAMRMGAVANPVLVSLRAHELAFIVEQAEPALLVVPAVFRGFDHLDMARSFVPDSAIVVVRGDATPGIESFDELLERGRPDAALPEPDADDPALLLYTSGTTARPKGVVHTHNTLRAEADGMAVGHECVPQDAILVTMPLGHIGGVLYGMLLPLTVGLTAVLLDRWDPEVALGTIEREHVTLLPGVPAYLYDMLGSEAFDAGAVASMRLFGLGGTRVTAEDVHCAAERFGCWSKRTYGSTEMPTLTTGARCDSLDRIASTEGTVIRGSEIRIVDGDGHDVAPGEAGEIWCRGPELFVGYLDAALNAEAFAADGWFRTGDLGSLDDDGFLTVTGRKKDVIIRGGENISPQEIEEMLLTLDEVEDIAIVAMPDAQMGERACAFVVASDASFDFDRMVGELKRRGVAAYKIPERLEVRTELPRTTVGKIRKDRLRDEVRGLLASEADQVRASSRKPSR